MKRIKRISFAIAVLVGTLLLGALPVSAEANIVDLTQSDGRFTILLGAVNQAGLADTLRGPGPFTLVAPTDSALAALPEGFADAYLDNLPALTDLVLSQAASGGVSAADLLWLSQAATLFGETGAIRLDGNTALIDGAPALTISELQATNGLLYVIDAAQPLKPTAALRNYPLGPAANTGWRPSAILAPKAYQDTWYPDTWYQNTLAVTATRPTHIAYLGPISAPYREPFDGATQYRLARLAYRDTWYQNTLAVTAPPKTARVVYADTFAVLAQPAAPKTARTIYADTFALTAKPAKTARVIYADTFVLSAPIKTALVDYRDWFAF